MPIDPKTVVIEAAPPDSADAAACMNAYFAELAQRFGGGFDPNAGASSPDTAMAPPDGIFLVARTEGRAVGCGGLKRIGPGVAEIKRMWVAGEARGLGLSRRLLAALEAEAVRIGFATLRLDTNRSLSEAQSLYRKAGYREIGRYNDNPYADHFFEKTLQSQSAATT